MTLEDIQIVPGAVVDIDDPKYIGRVKAAAPGFFDESSIKKEAFPWIYPLEIPGYQRFSTLRVGSKIWIIVVGKDCREFWYIPMFELTSDTRDIISAEEDDYKDAEILLSRNNGNMGVYIYYTPSQGIVIKNSDNTLINLTKDNEIIIKAGDGEILIKDNKVYLGKDDLSDTEPGVLGKKLKEVIDEFGNYISSLQQGLSANPYTTPVGAATLKDFTSLQTKLQTKYLSDNVELN